MTENLNADLDDLSSPGALLRSKREAQGLSIDDLSKMLKLQVRQIEALERDEFASLGSATHLRGYLRGYARHVGCDAAEVLRLLDSARASALPEVDLHEPGNTDVPMPAEVKMSHTPSRSGLILGALLVLLLAGGGLAWYLNPGLLGGLGKAKAPEAAAPAPQSASAVAVTPVVVAPAGQGAALPAAPVNAAPVPAAVAPVPAPAPMPPAPVAQPAPQPAPPVNAMPPAPSMPSVSAQVPAPAAPAVATPAPSAAANSAVAPAAQPGVHRLVLNFRGDSWVEIKDAKGAALISQKVPAGNTRILEGKAPFNVVVGNARNVQVQYDDKPVDLTPHTKVDVARFTLN